MSTAVLIPGTPLLIPGVGGGQDPAAGLRAIAVSAVREALPDDDGAIDLVVPDAASDSSFALHRLLGRPPMHHDHPAETADGSLSVAVGRSVLAAAGWSGPVTVRSAGGDHPSAGGEHPPAELSIMVGDGSALRRAGGPGVASPEALIFDDALLELITRGDAPGLIDLGEHWGPRAETLMITGIPTWSELGRMVDRPVRATVHNSSEPFGMLALIATWSW